MAFWGVEVKPGRPFTHPPNGVKGRLHVSQATLGIGSGTNKSVVQCNVGNSSPVFLCTLFPEKSEACQLNLEFEEADDVVFSVIGSRGVHITGYYLGNGHFSHMNEDSESFGEDIAVAESDRSRDDEEYEDSFIDDGDPAAMPSSPLPEEDISNDESSKKSKVKRRRLRKKYQPSESDKEDEPLLNKVSDVKEATQASDSEDIVDEFFMSLSKNQRDSKIAIKENKSRGSHDASENGATKDGEISDKSKVGDASAPMSKSVGPELTKKRKRKEKEQSEKASEVEEVPLAAQDATNGKGSNNKKKKKKKKEKKLKKNKALENEIDTKEETPADKVGGKSSYSGDPEIESSQIRKFPNGLIVEDLEPGVPDGKMAVRGKKISVLFVGKMKENGQIFDSNIRKEPLKFRLGKGEVMEGWDDGLEGIRAGGKRRLIIPPSLRKGSSKLKGKNVTPESWLIYDIEAVRVR